MRLRASACSLALSLTLGIFLALLLIEEGSGTGPMLGSAADAVSFNGDRRAIDVLPSAAETLAVSERPASVPESLFEGAWITSQSRRLVTASGHWDASLYVVPTDRGWLCTALVVHSPKGPNMSPGAGGCLSAFSDASPASLRVFDPDGLNAGGPAIVASVVPADVESVDVVVNGVSARATIQDQAVLYELQDNKSYPEAIAFNRSDGRKLTARIPDMPSGICGRPNC